MYHLFSKSINTDIHTPDVFNLKNYFSNTNYYQKTITPHSIYMYKLFPLSDIPYLIFILLNLYYI